MNFDIAEYIRQQGFEQTRESDKRDIFEKDYFSPFRGSTLKAVITIHYDAGYSEFNNVSVWLMTIQLGTENVLTLFDGIAPRTFDEVASLFELLMPSPQFLEQNYSSQ